jgi:H/ACA ribonucleoprotein complex subunit 2
MSSSLCSVVVFAGDVTPIDIICHLPAVCEEKDIPYAYTPSRVDLGAASGHKRASITMLIKQHADYQDLYDEVKTEMKHLPIPV